MLSAQRSCVIPHRTVPRLLAGLILITHSVSSPSSELSSASAHPARAHPTALGARSALEAAKHAGSSADPADPVLRLRGGTGWTREGKRRGDSIQRSSMRGQGGQGRKTASGARGVRFATATARDIRRGGDDSVLRHFLGKETYVKCEGNREFTGIVMSYDSYGNLVLDNTTEMVMDYNGDDDDDDVPVFSGETRFLGLSICHGKKILSLWPTEGTRDIENPFPVHEHEGLVDYGTPLNPDDFPLPPTHRDERGMDGTQDLDASGGGALGKIPGVEDISLESLSLLGGGWSHLSKDHDIEQVNWTSVANSAPPALRQWLL
jgi:U6 snRNA-associated Sm-like protein LSm7